jgi:hypothetical protein
MRKKFLEGAFIFEYIECEEKKLLTQESPDWRSTGTNSRNSHTGQRKEPQVMMERDM